MAKTTIFPLNGSDSHKNSDPLNGSVPRHEVPFEHRLEMVNQDLALRYSALNVALGAAEQLLKSLKPPHDVWIDYNHSEGGIDQWELVGLAKLDDKWRLCHAYDNEVDIGPPGRIQPLVDCPVEVRVRAAKEIKSLKIEIVKAKEAFLPQVDEAIKALQELCNDN